MKFSGTYTIAAPREEVFGALTDPAVLQRCIDGCEKIVKTGEDSYDAQLKIGLAGMKGTYTGKVQIKDKKPPESYTLILEGKGVPGFVKGSAKVQLSDKASQTELYCQAEAQVGGMISAIGSRLIEATAKKMTDAFFRRFGEHVTGGRS